MRRIGMMIVLAVVPASACLTTAAETDKEDAMSPPALLFIQGKLKPGAEGIYQQYLAGTAPLMSEYGARVTAVGAAVESELTTDAWPINPCA